MPFDSAVAIVIVLNVEPGVTCCPVQPPLAMTGSL